MRLWSIQQTIQKLKWREKGETLFRVPGGKQRKLEPLFLFVVDPRRIIWMTMTSLT